MRSGKGPLLGSQVIAFLLGPHMAERERQRQRGRERERESDNPIVGAVLS